MSKLIHEPLGMTVSNSNHGAHKLSVYLSLHKRGKHIDVRHHFITDAVAKDIVFIVLYYNKILAYCGNGCRCFYKRIE